MSVTTSNLYDVIVIGVGGIGSSICHQLGVRGIKALGIEQFQINHGKGSSSGDTRVIRKSYFEHPDYVPLLMRAYELWQETPYFHESGLIYYLNPNKSLVSEGLHLACKKYDLPLETVDSKNHFPAFNVDRGFEILFEQVGGYLEVENLVEYFVNSAKSNGVDIHFEEEVFEIKNEDGVFKVKTDKSQYEGKKLIISAGTWLSKLVPQLDQKLALKEMTLFWFKGDGDFSEKDPCFFVEWENNEFFYGFPYDSKKGLKVALHSGGRDLSAPSEFKEDINQDQLERVSAFVKSHFSGLNLQPSHTKNCMYTMTTDENFILDQIPGWEGGYFIGGLSGHGYKFSSVLGEVMSDLALERGTRYNLDFLKIRL